MCVCQFSFHACSSPLRSSEDNKEREYEMVDVTFHHFACLIVQVIIQLIQNESQCVKYACIYLCLATPTFILCYT